MTVKQFKLITGEEIICQVLEWATEEIPELVIRNAMVVVSVDSTTTGSRFYTFKPWMLMQEGDECLITINSNDVVAEANPVKELLKHYYRAVEHANLSEEELEAKISEYTNKITSILQGAVSGDSDEKNIIRFPSLNKVH